MRRKLFQICAILIAIILCAGAAADSADLLEVDHQLYKLGYRDEACNGELNEVMVNALRNFQRANDLEVTGEPDVGTVLMLFSDSAISQADYLNRLSQQNSKAQSLLNGYYGDGVMRLQKVLRELGYYLGNSDGVYGISTGEAVSRFQLANGLPMTGVADSQVMQRLYSDSPIAWEDFLSESTAALGDSGAKVHALQFWLQVKGYFEGECTGRYGENTQQAVRQLQSAAGLMTSGDADLDTCRALYTNVSELLANAAALHRGDAGAEVQTLCDRLISLGYAAHEVFDLQTELALMQFQRANGLSVTGVADLYTQTQAQFMEAVQFEQLKSSDMELTLEEDFSTRIMRHAMHLLGQTWSFDDDFGLIQYVYMKCGVMVLNRSAFASVGTERGEAVAGDVLVFNLNDRERCGLMTSDGAVIYCAEDMRIVMSYPSAMEFEHAALYRLAPQG